MGHQVLGGGDDLGHARLVVGAEQRVPDAVTMSWPMCAASDGSSARAQHRRGIVGQHEVAPVVGAVHDRLDVVRPASRATCRRER